MTPEKSELVYRLVETKRKIQKARFTLPDTNEILDRTHFIMDLLKVAEEHIDKILADEPDWLASVKFDVL